MLFFLANLDRWPEALTRYYVTSHLHAECERQFQNNIIESSASPSPPWEEPDPTS